jgi:hypothetical protein
VSKTTSKLVATTAAALVLGLTGAASAFAASASLNEVHRNDQGSDSKTFHLDEGHMDGNLSFTCNNGSVVVSLYHEEWPSDQKAGGSTTVSCDGQKHNLHWDYVTGGDYHFHFDPVNAGGDNPLHVVGDVGQ